MLRNGAESKSLHGEVSGCTWPSTRVPTTSLIGFLPSTSRVSSTHCESVAAFGRRGADHQLFLIDNPAHVADLRELLRDQGGRRAIDAHLRQGGRSARHHGQRRLAWANQHGVVRRGQERSGHPAHGGEWPRSDGSANRKTSPTSCCSWRLTRPVGSLRRTLGLTAGWPDQCHEG